ncbi:tryptophan 2,3-dioxygenase family protein [Pseudonocardia adelaidensis]|uniref:tryptophan 2,3-dioxygenase family protein n=1 Tax=Pseudonocardia adelaidensis TaxID=648754 RepID=UPI0031E88399
MYSRPEDDPELVELGERLIEVADLYRQWRHCHFVTVERVMGSKPGTGGTSGVEWLRKVTEHRFFEELWDVRSSL